MPDAFAEKLARSSIGQALQEIEDIKPDDSSTVIHTLSFDYHDQKRDYFARSLCGTWAWDMVDGHSATDDEARVTCEVCLGRP